MSEYIGIDYSRGQSNIDKATGIRYGVISQGSVGPAWFDEAEAQYGEPHCPQCGEPVKEPDADSEDEDGSRVQGDYYCPKCKLGLHSERCFPDEPQGYTYEGEGYKLTDCLDNDIFVLQSPYFTHAQFCSPCVPGAGNLDTPVANGPRTYCLGHDWFEGGKAPYPVYSVESGHEIRAVEKQVACVTCGGSGRDTLARVSQVRGCNIADVAEEIVTGKLNVAGYDSFTNTFTCWRCEGKRTLPEIVYEEIENEAPAS